MKYKGPDIPLEPVDRFRIDWWVISPDGTALRRRHAIYFVDAPYHYAVRLGLADKVHGDSTYGARLVEQFMLYSEDIPLGRDSWSGLWGYLHQPHYSHALYFDEIEAWEALVEGLLQRRDSLEMQARRADSDLTQARWDLEKAKRRHADD